MKKRTDQATQNNLPVLKVVDPALVDDGDELDDIGGVESAHTDD